MISAIVSTWISHPSMCFDDISIRVNQVVTVFGVPTLVQMFHAALSV